MRPNHENTRRAWQRYVDTGELSAELLRSHIHRAWQRCAAHGTSPQALQAQTLSPGELSALLEREASLIEAARPYMQALSRAAGSENHAAMLSDRHAVVLDVIGNEQHVHTQGFPAPGSLLAERNAGANGIGTPLAEGSYVEVVGPEHFIEGFHVYTCQGTPVKGPDGEIAGALSISVRRLEVAERVHEVMICAAYGIEMELIRDRLERDVEAVLTQADCEPALDQLRQDVVQLQSAARLRLERAARVARDGTPEEVVQLTFAANQLAARFRRQSRRWREIASGLYGAPQPLDVRERVGEIAELLETEAAIRRVRVSLVAGPPAHLTFDSRELSRLVFRAFLQAFASSAGPDVQELTVSIETAGDEVHVRYESRAGELTLQIASHASAAMAAG